MCWSWWSYIAGMATVLVPAVMFVVYCILTAGLVDSHDNPIVKVQNERGQ